MPNLIYTHLKKAVDNFYSVHKLQYDYLAEKAFQWRDEKFHLYVFGNVFYGIHGHRSWTGDS